MNKKRKILTVTELIKLLRKMPKNAPVRLEGCDCYGDAKDVKYFVRDSPEQSHVAIRRYP